MLCKMYYTTFSFRLWSIEHNKKHTEILVHIEFHFQIDNTPDVIPFVLSFFSFPVQVYSILFFFHAVTTILYIYRLRVWRILYFHASLRSVFKYQLLLLFFTSLVWFFHMLANQMRILRINGVYYHKNGHMCVIEVERKITSLFYVILCIYFWNEA